MKKISLEEGKKNYSHGKQGRKDVEKKTTKRFITKGITPFLKKRDVRKI